MLRRGRKGRRSLRRLGLLLLLLLELLLILLRHRRHGRRRAGLEALGLSGKARKLLLQRLRALRHACRLRLHRISGILLRYRLLLLPRKARRLRRKRTRLLLAARVKRAGAILLAARALLVAARECVCVGVHFDAGEFVSHKARDGMCYRRGLGVRPGRTSRGGGRQRRRQRH